MSKKKRNQKKVEAGRERARKSREHSTSRIFRDGELLTKAQSAKQLKQEGADKAEKSSIPPWVSPARKAALGGTPAEMPADKPQEEPPTEELVEEIAEKAETIAERLKRIKEAG